MTEAPLPRVGVPPPLCQVPGSHVRYQELPDRPVSVPGPRPSPPRASALFIWMFLVSL